MDAQVLVQKANQIADFFEAFPERGEAVEGVFTHLKKFWEPRMRRQLVTIFADQAEQLAMRPLVRETLERHRGELA